MRDDYQDDPVAKIDALVAESRAMAARSRIRVHLAYGAIQRTGETITRSRVRAEEIRDFLRKVNPSRQPS